MRRKGNARSIYEAVRVTQPMIPPDVASAITFTREAPLATVVRPYSLEHILAPPIPISRAYWNSSLKIDIHRSPFCASTSGVSTSALKPPASGLSAGTLAATFGIAGM